MRNYPFYQVDAFASRAFEGNQACVMPMDAFLSDDMLQTIAAENNVAETAYIVPDGAGRWKLRWFTPTVEVPLCGHATLASAHVIFEHFGYQGEEIVFETVQSGELKVRKADIGYQMDFPAPSVQKIEIEEAVVEALGARPVAAYGGPFYAAMFEDPKQIRHLAPDLKALARLGVSDTFERGNFGCFAEGGAGVDVTSRFFAPGSGIDEDPATGSWHCMLTEIMATRTGRQTFFCYQAYPGRGARIDVEKVGDRIMIKGRAVTVIEGRFSFADKAG